MRELTGSPVCDIRAVKSKRHAARYLGKYLTKGAVRFEGCKRYWRSQDWLEPDDFEPSAAPAADHYVIPARFDEFMARGNRLGSMLVEDVRGRTIVLDFWCGRVLRC